MMKLIEPVFILLIAINTATMTWLFRTNGENKYLMAEWEIKNKKKTKNDVKKNK